MQKEIIYSLKSPYRTSLDITAFHFGEGKNTIAVVGAMRGSEIEQMYICSLLIKELKAIEKSGGIVPGNRITVIPCINYYSMNIGKRFWAMDNTDINRMFPGYDMGETTQRIADGVFSAINSYEYGIGLASFYQPGNFLPHVKLMETGFTDKNLMKLFGTRYGIVRTPRPYDTTTLNYNWQIWETKAFSLYSCNTDKIDEASSHDSVNSILRFMSGVNIISKKIRNGYNTEIISENNIEQLHTEKSGIFISHVKVGEEVEGNDILAEIKNPFDNETVSVIKTHVSGIVYFEHNSPLINENTTCFKIIKN